MGVIVFLAGSLQFAGAAPQDVFGSMSGFWMGPGRIEFTEGASEALVCKAYYTTAGQANRLSIALRCASPSQKIELRAQLVAQGSNLTGTWEERTYNASGTVTGQATDQQITFSIDGAGFTATMQVIQDSGQQTVSITTQGVGFKTVSVALSRNASDQKGQTSPTAR
ncbi:hypothetical protein GIW81_18735 [Hyphomicrobium sp. xq]|uniref:Lipocalin-like domain-containing protein n=1 Tax=Hyphomicrobium album TaxID=2665159 RepID=A0A6I3KPB6_9HYPH|nr:hypothetical protein [Hyphomicrobium album]MTD96379.1 hypothetical protein [Hyphomicrobium album]